MTVNKSTACAFLYIVFHILQLPHNLLHPTLNTPPYILVSSYFEAYVTIYSLFNISCLWLLFINKTTDIDIIDIEVCHMKYNDNGNDNHGTN